MERGSHHFSVLQLLCRHLAKENITVGLTPLCTARMHAMGLIATVTFRRPIEPYMDYPTREGATDVDFGVCPKPNVCCSTGEARSGDTDRHLSRADQNPLVAPFIACLSFRRGNCKIPPVELLPFKESPTDHTNSCEAISKLRGDQRECLSLLQLREHIT